MDNEKSTTSPNLAGEYGPAAVYSSGGFRIDKLGIEAFRTNNGLIEKAAAMLASTYENPWSVLRREIARCTHIYLGTVDDEIISFFLVSWEYLLLLDGTRSQSIYMGLSASCNDKKNSGEISCLYFRILADGAHYEKQQQKKIILWAIATPTSYILSHAMLSNVQPYLDGTFSKEAAAIAEAVRLQHAYEQAGGHPFILKDIAADTLYLEKERERVAQIVRIRKFDLFQRLDIREHRGDRLLIIANTPADDRSLKT